MAEKHNVVIVVPDGQKFLTCQPQFCFGLMSRLEIEGVMSRLAIY
jgi:hypothetical protein